MTLDYSILLAAFILGISSSWHCVFMCGGVSNYLLSNNNEYNAADNLLMLLLFHGGRLLCYSSFGLLAGVLLLPFGLPEAVIFALRMAASIIMVLIGCYLAGWAGLIGIIERRMAFAYQAVQPFMARFTAPRRWHHAVVLGFCWGFLPCGLVYSTLLWSIAVAPGWGTAACMLLFGMGTVPALLLLNFASVRMLRYLRHAYTKKVVALVIVLFGIWSAPIWQHLASHQHVPGAIMQGEAEQQGHKDHNARH